MSKTVVNKVTKVVWDNGFKPDGVNIPSVTSADQGKVLAVDSNGKWVAASPAAPQSELPVYTAADEGKILKVDDQGALEWAEDDNTEYTAGDNISIVNGEISAVDTTYTAGDNIEISAENVISATDTTYTAGTGISIDGSNVISADAQLPSVTSTDEGKVLKVDANGDWAVGTDNDTTYTAGSNVQINGGVISATDTTYTAGANISISAQNEISATDTTYSDATTTDAGLMSAADKVKLNGIETGAEANVNADWNAASGDAQILNKPNLAAVATSGDYTDLTNKPTIPSYSAGANVQINDGVISATDTTYTAGTNVQINNGVISATDTVYTLPTADASTLGGVKVGTNLAIDANGVLSATDTTYSAGSGISITGTVIAADAQLPAYSATENGKVLSVDGNGDLEWATPSGGGGVMMPDPTNVLKTTTSITSTNTTYTATQDCYVSFALTGATGTSASSGLDFYVVVQRTGASPSVSSVLYEAGGRSLGNANVAPSYKGGFYLKSGWYATITSTIHAIGTSFGEYTVYALA